jgi:hypothetical protein
MLAGAVSLKDTSGVRVECCDCGRERWLSQPQIRRLGSGSINDLGSRLYCASCRQEGSPGKNVCISPLSRQNPSNSRKGMTR